MLARNIYCAYRTLRESSVNRNVNVVILSAMVYRSAHVRVWIGLICNCNSELHIIHTQQPCQFELCCYSITVDQKIAWQWLWLGRGQQRLYKTSRAEQPSLFSPGHEGPFKPCWGTDYSSVLSCPRTAPTVNRLRPVAASQLSIKHLFILHAGLHLFPAPPPPVTSQFACDSHSTAA